MRAILMFGLLAACGDPADTGDGSGGQHGSQGGDDGGGSSLSAAVLSPADGAVFMEGDPVSLEVELRGSGQGFAPDSATWTAGGWSGEGNPLTASDLPVGELTIRVEAWSGGDSAEAEVAITVEPRQPVSYAGPMDADVELDSPAYSDSGPCAGNVSFVREVDDTLSGEGSCYADLQSFGTTVVFVLTGQVNGERVSGTLAVEGYDESTPFDGSLSAAGEIDASFDQTWTQGSGSLRIWGSFAASPAGR